MKINSKLRLQNKATLLALVPAVIALVYQILGLIGIVAPISESELVNIVVAIINALAVMGIIVDPTTKGIGDSAQALEYDAPKSEEE